MNKLLKKLGWLSGLLLLVGFVSRVLPHTPNATAIIFASLALGAYQPRTKALLVALGMWISTDCALALINHHAVFGSWSFFTYSGALGVVFLGSSMKARTYTYSLAYLFLASFLFWTWTNFGVWLFSGMYEKTFHGLSGCYTAALPFLRNQWWGDLVWFLLFAGIFSLIAKFQLLYSFFKIAYRQRTS